MQRPQDAESMYTKATKSELAQDYDSAFHLYIKAAELFLHLSRSTSATENDKSQWKKSASRALDRAERIKQMTEKSRPSPTSASQSEAATKLTPVGVDYFSPEEQSYVLKKGSNINGTVFPLWHEPGPSLQKQPRLSSLQTKFEAVWKHEVEDLLTNHHPIFPQDVSQSIVTDCSVCASISSCIEHDKRFGSNLAKAILHNSTSTKPQSGRSYDLKLLFNGGWRRIRIDGQLPYHPTLGIPLCLTCKSSDSTQDATKKVTVSWPSIIEKGYMVLMGGYDFPGSNTAIDLHTFTGWIPEHIEIKSANFESERTWSRILWDFNNGNCMFTFGTGVKPGIQWRDRSLLSTHSYAVLDVREDKNGNGRFITVLDSWPNSESLEIALQERPNLIEIPWLEALDVFEGIYLNWDPQIWSSSLTYRAMWRARTDKKACTHQVRAKLDRTGSDLGEIWVLLTRHVNDTRKLGEFIACKIQIEDDEAGCSVVCEKQKISHKGAFTNSPHVLARMHIPPLNQSASLSILAICENCTEDTGFDVTIYAPKQVRLTWVKDIPKFPFTKTLEDTLISQNSGGNHTYPTFMINPQYHLRLYPSNQDKMSTAKRTTLIVEINKDVPIQVMICWSQGERVKEPAPKSVVATSGSYAHGLARLTEQLLPGDYSIIVSTFEPQQTGAFSLSVNSFASFDVTPIPQEGAGMYRKTVKGMWDGSSAAGAPGFNRYFQNPIYELNLPAYSQILIRLQLLCPSSSTGLNVTIYPAMADSTSKNHHVATSGPYDDPITGVATPLTSLPKGRYWVVPSTYSPGTQSGFQLIVFSTLASIEITRR